MKPPFILLFIPAAIFAAAQLFWCAALFLVLASFLLLAFIGVAESLQAVASVLLGIADGWNHAKHRREVWAESIKTIEVMK